MLRKRETPCVVPLHGVASRDVEWRTFMATYKGVTDFITKYVWPWPAFWVTRWAAHHRINPNMVTSVGLILVFVACWLFASDHLWLGLAAAWLMTFLDTVDGKLARTTLTFSRHGALYDHAIDYIHQPFWWMAWWFSLQDEAGADVVLLDVCLMIAVGGYAAQRLIEETFKRIYKVRIHVWQRVDSVFRLVTARRNPNLVILSACMFFDAPVAGFILVAIWTAISVVFHLVRFAQAEIRRFRGQKLQSWLEQGA
jgi:phosphatidylglycerophosphate synthase